MSYTQVDNTIIDNLKGLSSRELKVLLYIQRQTRGWQRLSALIPPSRFSEATGVRIDHCTRTIKDLEARGRLFRIKEGKEYRYFPSLHSRNGYIKRKHLPF